MKGFDRTAASRVRRGAVLAAASLVAIALSQPAWAQATASDPAQTSGAAQDNSTGQPSADSAADDIVVVGVRGAQRAAVQIKRQSAEIVDSIVAEDIGKLPDATIADSLQRVPGIQIGRSAGEGSSVNVRGLGQVLVTLNGEQFLGGQSIDNAQPNFTDIPPSLFAGVDVYKSPSARQVEGGVSGTIDLKTRRPFDLKEGLTATGSAETSYGSRVKKFNQLYSGLLGYHNGRFGLLVAGSYSKARLANIGIDTGNSWLISTDALSGTDLRGDGDITDSNKFADKDYVYQPAVVSNSNRQTERERYGLNASAQFAITDQLTLTGYVAYTKLNDDLRAVNIQLNSGYAPRPLLPGSQVDENGVVTVGNFALPGFTANSLATNSRSRTYNTNLELTYENDGVFKGTLRWVHGDARRTSDSSQADSKPVTGPTITRGTTAACRVNPAPAACTGFQNPNGFPAVNVGIDYTTKYPTLNFGTDVSNPANWILFSTWGYGDERTAKTDAFRADGTYTVGGFLKTIDAGIRYNTRDVSVSEYKLLAPVTVDGLGTLNGPGDLYYFKDAGIGHTGNAAIEGRSVLPIYTFAQLGDRVRNYNNFIFGGVPSGGIPAIDPNAMSDPLAFQNSLYPGNAAYNDPTRSFRVTEKTGTAYLQANFGTENGGLFGMDLSGNVGVRYTTTRRSVYANTTDPNRFIGTGGNYNGVFINLGTNVTRKTIDRWLPSLNLTLDIDDRQKLRFAAAKVVGELNLFDLGAGRVLYYGANNGRYPNLPSDLQVFLQGNSGNPDLEPYQSNNYNASYEFYFGRGGLFSAAVFLFDVKSFPQSINTIQPIADADGVVRAGGVISTTGNGTGGKIKGIEVGYQQQFDFLPGFLSGFGANANFTLSDSESSNRDLFGKTLPVPDNSKYQYNLIGFYQKGPVQARVAYNWRSKRFAGLQSVNGVADGDVLAIYSKPVGYLDASASYDITPNFTVFAQGTNLTSASDQQYAQFENLYYQQNIFERRLTFGIRIRN
ncbi:TonB-dependent receptor [Sphingomonas sp. EC-HK361]|uniref:TonB-dependent receptor n=1 Tax=Sphingomonas sp. EC-HK361 TaxID=2038397 RepID=UPI00125A5673|nr:TonB-dependent receptor [Sphingomonas sp. EC-HK361]VVT22052.1 TonB-dependent receptor [Sphingomonas sp. EC-HK361]